MDHRTDTDLYLALANSLMRWTAAIAVALLLLLILNLGVLL